MTVVEPVDLVDADPGWTIRGEQERDYLETLLAPWLIARIEHIGSTAIPDLPAEPIIDLQALVADLRHADPIAAALAPRDWHYVGPDLDQRPGRRFFGKVTRGRRSVHLHVMTPDSPRWNQQIAFCALQSPSRSGLSAIRRHRRRPASPQVLDADA